MSESENKYLSEKFINLFDDLFINKLSNKEVVEKYNISEINVMRTRKLKAFKIPLAEYFETRRELLREVQANYIHKNNKKLTPELRELFTDIFVNKIPNKFIAEKYNYDRSYVSKIKGRVVLRLAIEQFFEELKNK